MTPTELAEIEKRSKHANDGIVAYMEFCQHALSDIPRLIARARELEQEVEENAETIAQFARDNVACMDRIRELERNRRCEKEDYGCK